MPYFLSKMKVFKTKTLIYCNNFATSYRSHKIKKKKNLESACILPYLICQSRAGNNWHLTLPQWVGTPGFAWQHRESQTSASASLLTSTLHLFAQCISPWTAEHLPGGSSRRNHFASAKMRVIMLLVARRLCRRLGRAGAL